MSTQLWTRMTHWMPIVLTTVALALVVGGCPVPDAIDGGAGTVDGVDQTGQDGQDGSIGPQGPEGPPGTPGQQGPTGVQGSTGLPGAQGSTGPTGTQGEPGVAGVQGEPGTMGAQGAQGISCWDLNGNGVGDPGEDFNGDGSYNTLDCQNLPGPQGMSCWDLNMNGVGDPEEDVNGDGNYDALDCQNLPGPQGLPCWDLNGDGVGTHDEDINGDGNFDAYDCQGEMGPVGPVGPQGEQGPPGPQGVEGPQGIQGEQGPPGPEGPDGPEGEEGPPGIHCWDQNMNGIDDPEEDMNGDGIIDSYDCIGDGVVEGMFWQLGGNNVVSTQAFGTLGEAAIEVIVDNKRALRIEPSAGTPNLIGGFGGNLRDGEASGVTVAGGGAMSDFFGNSGAHLVSADFATIGGGLANSVGGIAATVPGGMNNVAEGEFSFAAGHGAQALHPGSFVWADSTDDEVVSMADNEFRVRCGGGAAFEMGSVRRVELRSASSRFIYTSTNAFLSSGGTWTNASDRNLKDNFEPVDGRAVLDSLVNMPVFTWNYLEEDVEIRHMGPMAQDFYAVFGLGYGETSIATIDAEGVALAAVKGLYEIAQEQAGEIAAQQATISNLQTQVSDLEQRVVRLERLLSQPTVQPDNKPQQQK